MPALSFIEAAYQILKITGHPLSAEEITSAALSRDLIVTSGKTPVASMTARLYTDIKDKGNASRFVKLEKRKYGLKEWTGTSSSNRIRSIVGDPINLDGLIYGPLNENGVIFLFSKIHHKFGINIEAIQASFPDAKGRRKTAKGWEEIWIEFEFKSSNFKANNHDPKECDIIVCWEHDWKECPLEVISLKEYLKTL